MSSPESCPTCGTGVPEGAPRCPGCGRVFGEENRCPHCHAIAAVLPRGGHAVCAACGKPRDGSTFLDARSEGGARRIQPRTVRGTRGRAGAGRGYRVLGVLALAAGLVGAALVAAAVPSSVVGLILAAAVGGAGVGVGALGFQTAARRQRDAERQARRDRELAILQLAEERGGALTATEVARELHIAPDEAEDALTAMVGDGTRVGVEVDREGVLRYAFRELMPPPELRVRVEPEPETEPSEVSAEGQRAAEGRAPEG